MLIFARSFRLRKLRGSRRFGRPLPAAIRVVYIKPKACGGCSGPNSIRDHTRIPVGANGYFELVRCCRPHVAEMHCGRSRPRPARAGYVSGLKPVRSSSNSYIGGRNQYRPIRTSTALRRHPGSQRPVKSLDWRKIDTTETRQMSPTSSHIFRQSRTPKIDSGLRLQPNTLNSAMNPSTSSCGAIAVALGMMVAKTCGISAKRSLRCVANSTSSVNLILLPIERPNGAQSWQLVVLLAQSFDEIV